MQSPSIPLWVGGMGERRTLRVVAEVADGWNTFLMPEEEYRHKLDVLAEHCKDFGREPGNIRKQLGVSVILGETEAEVADRAKERAAAMRTSPDELLQRFMAVTPERCAEILRPFLDLGVGDFLMLSRARRRAHDGAVREAGGSRPPGLAALCSKSLRSSGRWKP